MSNLPSTMNDLDDFVANLRQAMQRVGYGQAPLVTSVALDGGQPSDWELTIRPNDDDGPVIIMRRERADKIITLEDGGPQKFVGRYWTVIRKPFHEQEDEHEDDDTAAHEDDLGSTRYERRELLNDHQAIGLVLQMLSEESLARAVFTAQFQLGLDLNVRLSRIFENARASGKAHRETYEIDPSYIWDRITEPIKAWQVQRENRFAWILEHKQGSRKTIFEVVYDAGARRDNAFFGSFEAAREAALTKNHYGD